MLWQDSNGGSISVSGFHIGDVLVLSTYVSPSCDFKAAIDQLRTCLSGNNYERIVVAGDFNVNWNVDSEKKRILENFLQEYRLKSDLFASVFSTSNSGSVIDYIFHNFDIVNGGKYISHTSYHDPLFIKFNLQ
ncbi:uncharacterized protein EV154DRAFT_479898 [Mucor mucedo]|uniref:uncharacterized protein n=1 Tax=Mucor mucedo TaxID=29922 RepID=UPI002220161B|nr:uncharacterized protein EV154DRAFT_479898 [Mucor mucedo]KAI7892808.1 hypothetical protein EV154DRAFT_479898 [Mucor mucedo]